MTDPMGRVTDYQYDLKGRLVKEIQAVGTPEQAEMSYEYDAVGNQTAVIDENGQRTEFEYDSQNRITKITEADPDGVGDLTSPVTSLTYDKSGNLIKTVDPLGNTSEQEYDELNRLSLVTDSLDQETKYEYDKAGNVIATTDAEGRRTENHYDSRDRLTETIDPLGNKTAEGGDRQALALKAREPVTKYKYDSNDNLIAVTDALGNKTRSFYDSRDCAPRTSKADRLFRISDGEGNITNYEYDAADNLIATVDGNGNRTEYEYDDLDRQVKRIDALAGESSITYDAVGNVIATTDEEGRTTELGYDERDRLVQTTNAEDGVASFEYDDVGNLLATVDEENRRTSYSYDGLNRQIEVEDPLGNTNQTSYDHGGNLTSTTDGKGNIIHYAYDQLNRLSVVTNPFGDKMTTSYDAVGNVTAVTDELGRTTTFTYDDRNLQTAITDPLNHISTTKYDAVGNAIAITDPLGNKTSYSYDDIYRLIATTDAENRTTSYEYDPVGNLLSLTDPEENTTSYTYDKLNRLVTDTNQLGDSRTYGYDKVGNRTKTSDRNGRVINYSFDKLNRNTGEVWLDGNNQPIHTFEFEYDAASQLLNASDLNSAYDYEYDEAGRLVEVDNAGTPNVPNVVLNYGYDAANNLIEVKDQIDGVSKGVETFGYDELNRVTKITQSGDGVSEKRVDMSYDKASQMTGLTRFSDLAGTELVAESNYTFDDAGRLTNLVHDQDGDVLSAYEWAYDGGDRITKATTPDGVSDYSYDKTDQLTQADHSVQADENFTYDDNGNRVNNGYEVSENNQLLSDGTYNYSYDKEGNRVSRVAIATGEVTKYEWDYRNRLTGVFTKDSSGIVVERNQYTYDVFDNRIAKSVDADGAGVGVAKEEHFVYDGDHLALTFDGEGNQTERFLHGTQIDQVLAQENAGGEVLWALTDNQGSVRMLLDNNGDVVNNITYDAFGNITLETNPDVNFRFSYTGRELDDETGLYNYRTRFFDPKTGQFINEDRIGFAGGDSNLYRYVTNSPVKYTDPFGNIAPVVIGGIVLVAIVADLLIPDGVNAPTAPRDSQGNRIEPGDPRLNSNTCSSEPVNLDQPQNLDQSLKRAAVETVLSAGLGSAGKVPTLAKSLLNSADDLTNVLAKNLDNILPKNLGDIPVLVDGLLDDAAKQAGKVDDLLTDGFGNLQGTAAGLGAAADDLFKPYFESRNPGDGAYHGPKPGLENPGHHDPSTGSFRGGGSKTTPVPQDATDVYKKAIPDQDGISWYGRNAQGDIYRYSGSKNPGDKQPVHFNGSTNSPRGLDVPPYIERRFKAIDRDLKKNQ